MTRFGGYRCDRCGVEGAEDVVQPERLPPEWARLCLIGRQPEYAIDLCSDCAGAAETWIRTKIDSERVTAHYDETFRKALLEPIEPAEGTPKVDTSIMDEFFEPTPDSEKDALKEMSNDELIEVVRTGRPPTNYLRTDHD